MKITHESETAKSMEVSQYCKAHIGNVNHRLCKDKTKPYMCSVLQFSQTFHMPLDPIISLGSGQGRPLLVFKVVLEIEPRVLHKLYICFTTE
jgi:hypothetical protein